MSDTAKQLLLAQGQLQRSIVRSVDNLKKLGRANVTPAILRSRISTIKENWALFFRGHSELLRSVSEEVQQSTPYFKDGHYDVVEDAYQSALDYMNESLETLEPPAVSLNQTSSDAGFSRSNFSLSHLPPISLPPFDGTLNAWEHFRDRFNALIIQNRDLKDFARMHYLVSCLTGSALECVRDLAVTADNFENAWQSLNLRFENKRRLVRSHLSTLLNLPTVSKESAGELQALIDKVNSTITSLKKLDRRPKDLWNDILVYIVSQRLDAPSRKSWSMRISDSDDLPSFSELLEFLQHRRRALDDLSVPPARVSAAKALPHRISASTASSTSASGSGNSATSVAPPASSLHASSNAGPSSRCPICQAKHYFNACPSFVKGSLSQRRNFVQSHKRCFNCLGGNHSSRECPSKYTCRHCHQKHHTLLHDSASTGSGSSSSSSQVSAVSDTAKSDDSHAEVTSLVASRFPPRGATPVLLATAWISVIGPSGRELRVRALIDQGSEMTFVLESITNVLHLKRVRCPVTVSAVGGQSAGTYQFASSLSISPVGIQSVSIQVLALILPKLTSYSPRCATDLSSLSHLHGLKFADDNPTGGEPINVILGADVYNKIILSGFKRGAPGQLIAQNSIFGWILSGPIESRDSNARCASHHVRIAAHHAFAQDNDAIDLADALERFWKCEEPPERHATSVEDEHCESHFLNTYSRNSDGRFVVRLPFKKPPPLDIGNSRARALHCINSLLRRFRSTPEQSAAYRAFMSEYTALGHMRLAPSVDPRAVFILHHSVFRPDSATSRIRVVFNASSRTSNGSSLNDHLYAGPKLQSDLPTVILRWRIFRFVCTADIAKMYRQILVNENDVDFQRILWQPDPSDEIREFQLLTVTYGTACAPFLALRVLKQLSQEDGRDSPLAQHILTHHIYVDDVLFGADDTVQLVEKRNQLVTLLRRGCFTLRKWASNSPLLLSDIDPEDHGLACSPIPVADEHLKVLGIHWMPFADEFRFRVTVSDTLPMTKRSILSVIAKLYNPIGWVTPTIICAKIIIQHLWKLKVSWDDPVPPLIMSRWEKVYSSFSCLNSLQIPRWIGFSAAPRFIELHGFADASSEAYAAVVYSRVISTSGEITVSLLMGKSKVAPLKLLSIPRLELCAAVLLAKLLEFVTSLFTDYTVKNTCWTDSSIVLAWLRHPPSHWKTFVANRVADIQERIPGVDWRHVVTGDNPADCASRGLTGTALLTHSLWWHGPPWLSRPSAQWPNSLVTIADASLEAKDLTVHVTSAEPFDLSDRFSSWPKLIRVTAYLFCFIALCRRRPDDRQRESVPGALTASECAPVKLFWLKFIQAATFAREVQALTSSRPVSSKSPLSPLNVFLDRDGLIRVGGRIRRAPLTFTLRHPIVLSAHPLVTLLISHAHLRSMHGGLQLTLNTLRREYWILRARSLTKVVIHKCVTCVRERAAAPSQLMGDLPAYRVSAPARCFTHCGLDYAGPFLVRSSGGRGIKATKCYISVFVCMATRAIHLELVPDYSTLAFLNAFSRFCSRRGCPTHVYSDNGTTFVGAERELMNAYRASIRNPLLHNRSACENISWHFIPPAAPHFGGMWEAGVKSVKFHLRRVIGAHTLTFEEFSTLLCRIEACLNSRPIAPLTDSCDSYDVLTPGHFLIGSALTAPPEESTLDCSENRLNRWQLIRHMTERLWALWYVDYVNTLQQRVKWRRSQPTLKIGQLVVLKNSALPPCKWELGRITECFPGADGLIRVVTVKTASSELKRPLSKICVLPIDVDSPAPVPINPCSIP